MNRFFTILVCAAVASIAMAFVLLGAPAHAATPAWNLYAGTSLVAPRVDYVSADTCMTAARAQLPGTYTCRSTTIITIVVPVPPKPANESRLVTCPAGSITGATWRQTRAYVAAPAPVYWVAQTWLPTTAPVPPAPGACQPAPPPPHMHAGLDVDVTSYFTGAPGRGVEMLQSPPGGNLAPGSNGTGDFRTVCGFSHTNNDDSIVSPGLPGVAHSHDYFANTLADAFSTDESIRRTGNSTCRGGTIIRSAIWAPSMVDLATMKVIRPRVIILYYKQANGNLHPELTVALPRGFKAVAGDPSATQGVRWGPVGFSCNGNAVASDGAEPWDGGPHVIPDACPTDANGSHELWGAVSFGECSDGRADSADHRSHLVYWPSPNYDAQGNPRSTCPLDHPNHVPQITVIVIWPIPPGADISKWTPSCQVTGKRGSCFHVDYRNGWEQGDPDPAHPEIPVPDRMQQFIDGCLKKTLDCGASLLDSNTEMLGFDDV